MKSIKVTVYAIVFSLLNVLNSSSTTILDNEFVTDELNRPELSIGQQKDEIFFADQKPTKVSEEDVKWMKMIMQKYWTYLRSSNVSIDGKGYSSSWAGFYDKEIYINWRAEVAWSSIILYNDGRSIVELRYFKPNNKISLIESKIKLKCTTCIQTGNALLSYAEEWKKPGNPDSAMGQVSTVIGEFLSFVGFQMTKAKVEFSGKRANKILKQQTDTFKGLLQESLFSNKWYLIQYNLSSSLPDKLIRMELEGNSFVPWKNRATSKKQKNHNEDQEQVRRQVIVRSAYLMDSNILPPDKDIKTIGKTWFVPASAFGQVVGNDVASDLDKISGSIQLRREPNINLNDTATVHISKKGSSMDNRIMFVYAPQEKTSMSKVHRSISIDPERIDIYYDNQNHFIHTVRLDGKVNIEMAKHIELWPDSKLTAAPYVEAEYRSTIISKNLAESKIEKQTMNELAKYIKKKFGINIFNSSSSKKRVKDHD